MSQTDSDQWRLIFSACNLLLQLTRKSKTYLWLPFFLWLGIKSAGLRTGRWKPRPSGFIHPCVLRHLNWQPFSRSPYHFKAQSSFKTFKELNNSGKAIWLNPGHLIGAERGQSWRIKAPRLCWAGYRLWNGASGRSLDLLGAKDTQRHEYNKRYNSARRL